MKYRVLARTEVTVRRYVQIFADGKLLDVASFRVIPGGPNSQTRWRVVIDELDRCARDVPRRVLQDAMSAQLETWDGESPISLEVHADPLPEEDE